MSEVHFDKIALIGIGLIGSSLARVIKEKKLAGTVVVASRSSETLERAHALGLGDSYTTSNAEAVRDADLVLTGEGRLDGTSLHGKACVGVAKLAGQYGVPTIALAGSLGPNAARTLDAGLLACFSICDGPLSLDDAMRDADRLLGQLTMNVVRTFVGSA